MAGLCTRRNAGRTSINDSGTPIYISAVFHASILTLTQAPTPAPASAPGPPGRYIDKDLQRTTKLALELFVKG